MMATIIGNKRPHNLRQNPQATRKFTEYPQCLDGQGADATLQQELAQQTKRRRLVHDNAKASPDFSTLLNNGNPDALNEPADCSTVDKQCSLDSSGAPSSTQHSAGYPQPAAGTAAPADAMITLAKNQASGDTCADALGDNPKSSAHGDVCKGRRRCSKCGTSKPAGYEWRRGPAGQSILCNACDARRSEAVALLSAAFKMTSEASANSGSSTESASAAPTSTVQVSTAPAQESCQAGISRSSSSSSAVAVGSESHGKCLKQTTPVSQQTQQPEGLRRSERQQQKRSRADAGLAAVAEEPMVAINDTTTTPHLNRGGQGKRQRTVSPEVTGDCKPPTLRGLAAVVSIAAAAEEQEELREAAEVLFALANGYCLHSIAQEHLGPQLHG